MNVNSSGNSLFNPEKGRYFLSNLESDREFLLRCALTHDWEPVVQFCAYMEEYTSANPYSTTRHLCTSQLLACDQYGNSVLQACCYYRPPVWAVRAILRVSRKLGCYEDLIHHRALDQSTALQVACATGSSVAVIAAILVVTSPSSRSPSLSPSGSKRHSIHPGTLVGTSDQQGATPLSDLVVQYTLERKGPRFIGCSQALEHIHDVTAECAHSHIFHLFWSKVKVLLEAAWDAHITCNTTGTGTGTIKTETTSTDETVSAELHESVAVTSTLDAETTVVTTQHRDHTLLHQAAAIAETCPTLLIDLLVRCFPPGEPCVLTFNETYLSLHCMLNPTTGSSVVQRSMDCPLLEKQRDYFACRLLRTFPPSASQLFGRQYQRSPLTYAVLRRWWWHSSKELGSPVERRSDDDTTPIKLICTLAPDTIEQPDILTGLYPWQLAATTVHRALPPPTTQDDLRQLETVYHLLRLVPNTIRL